MALEPNRPTLAERLRLVGESIVVWRAAPMVPGGKVPRAAIVTHVYDGETIDCTVFFQSGFEQIRHVHRGNEVGDWSFRHES